MKALSLFPKIFAFLLLASLAVLAVQNAAPSAIATSTAVQIPLELKLAFNALVLFGATFGMQWLYETVGIDLRGLAAALSVAVAEFALLQFQGWIDIVPAAYDLYVTIGLNVLLAVLTTLGYIRVAFHRERAAAMFLPSPPRLLVK